MFDITHDAIQRTMEPMVIRRCQTENSYTRANEGFGFIRGYIQESRDRKVVSLDPDASII